MVREVIGELFGPVADLAIEEAVLPRGSEPAHDAEEVIAALQRVSADERAEAFRINAKQVPALPRQPLRLRKSPSPRLAGRMQMRRRRSLPSVQRSRTAPHARHVRGEKAELYAEYLSLIDAMNRLSRKRP